jgi:hypothetical protein
MKGVPNWKLNSENQHTFNGISEKTDSLKMSTVKNHTFTFDFTCVDPLYCLLDNNNRSLGRLNNITGPREKQCTGAHTYTTTHRYKTVNVYTIKHIYIVLVFPTMSVFKP